MKKGSFHRFYHILWLSIFLIVLPISASAREILVSGTIIDSISREPIPYVAVYVTASKEGKLADEQGHFSLWKKNANDSLRFSVMGYSEKTVPMSFAPGKDIIVELVPTGVQLSEVVVKPRKEKYSKKNNPAVDFVNRIRNSKEKNDPRRHDFYSYRKYERISTAINDFNASGNYSWLG